MLLCVDRSKIKNAYISIFKYLNDYLYFKTLPKCFCPCASVTR